MAVKRSGFEARPPVHETSAAAAYQQCDLRASYLASLNLGFLIYKMGVTITTFPDYGNDR